MNPSCLFVSFGDAFDEEIAAAYLGTIVLVGREEAYAESNWAESLMNVSTPVEWYSIEVRPATKSGGVEAQVLWGGATLRF